LNIVRLTISDSYLLKEKGTSLSLSLKIRLIITNVLMECATIIFGFDDNRPLAAKYTVRREVTFTPTRPMMMRGPNTGGAMAVGWAAAARVGAARDVMNR